MLCALEVYKRNVSRWKHRIPVVLFILSFQICFSGDTTPSLDIE